MQAVFPILFSVFPKKGLCNYWGTLVIVIHAGWFWFLNDDTSITPPRLYNISMNNWSAKMKPVYDTNPLLICNWFLKNQFGKKFDELDFQSISNWIFTACVACKNQFWNWFLQAENPVCRTWFLQLDFSKIKYRSTGLLCNTTALKIYKRMIKIKFKIQMISSLPFYNLF